MTFGEGLFEKEIYKIDLEEFFEGQDPKKCITLTGIQEHSAFRYSEKERHRRLLVRDDKSEKIDTKK